MRKQAKQQLCESIEYLIQTSDTLRELLGKLGSGALMLYGTIVAGCILALNRYLGAIAFVVVGAFVLNDFLNILLKCFKDCYGKEISEDTVIK